MNSVHSLPCFPVSHSLLLPLCFMDPLSGGGGTDSRVDGVKRCPDDESRCATGIVSPSVSVSIRFCACHDLRRRLSCSTWTPPGMDSVSSFPCLVVSHSLLLSFCPMGQPTWATTEQTTFLEGFLPQLEEEKRTNGLTSFYVRVTQDFVRRWASPLLPTDDDGKSSPAQLKKIADDRRRGVSLVICVSIVNLH